MRKVSGWICLTIILLTGCATLPSTVQAKIQTSCDAYAIAREPIGTYLPILPENVQHALHILDDTLNALCAMNSLTHHP